MKLIDANVLIYAHRRDYADNGDYLGWLERTIAQGPVGTCDLVLAAFVRIVSNPRIYKSPTPISDAFDIVEKFAAHPNVFMLKPGDTHWSRFRKLCEGSRTRGNLVTDAYLAALALEHGAELVSADRDFARFKDLKWRHPMEA